MKNLVCLPKSFIAGTLLLLAGCVKEPSPDIPTPPKPERLLTKVVTLERRGEPEGGPAYYSAIVDEYHYNRQHKPWLHTEYTGTDTNNLRFVNADTLFYDKQLRPIRKSASVRYIYRTEYKYYYKGDERLPERGETISIDSSGAISSIRTSRYVYKDTIVYAVHDRTHQDTSTYVYNRKGNLIGDIYQAYDNTVNVNRFLNLDDVSPLRVREGDYGLLLSKNNWIVAVPTETWVRKLTYDGTGRVSSSSIQYYFPTRDVTTYYYYTLIQ